MNCLSLLRRSLYRTYTQFRAQSSVSPSAEMKGQNNNSQKVIKEDPYKNLVTNPKKDVYIVMSYDVWKNIALEDLYFGNTETYVRPYNLLLWVNDPCVIIGRHQNPFAEVDMCYLAHNDIPLVRRTSGGGAVYHDRGNLNMTFFTPRAMYNRRWNLEMVCEVIREKFNIDVHINKKDDIMVGDKKISGSAAKLTSQYAYHHLTLLIDTDLGVLDRVLRRNKNVKSRATESIPSEVVNLKSFNPEVELNKVRHAIGMRYKEKSLIPNDPKTYGCLHGFYRETRPMEWFYPGFMKRRERLANWDWVIGMTPKFEVDHHLIEGKVTLQVVKGIVDKVMVRSPIDMRVTKSIEKHLLGEKYRYDILSDWEPVREDNRPPPPGLPTPPDLSDNSFQWQPDPTPWLNI